MLPAEKEEPVHVFPAIRANGQTALSIIDSSVANYAPCSALWLFPRPSSSSIAYNITTLKSSLAHTLSAYPQWTGNLHIPVYDRSKAKTDHTRRFGRVHLSWGEEDDPGAELHVATSTKSVEDSVLRSEDGVTKLSITWSLYPPFTSLVNPRSGKSGPCMLIKLTTFSDGGLAIGIALHHTLSDTQTLLTFMRDWSIIHKSLTVAPDTTPKLPMRPFEPLKLDSHASGDIDAENEDSSIKEEALKIPQIRLDFWADANLTGAKSPIQPHPDIEYLDGETGKKRGKSVPWHQWDRKAPVADRYIHFSPVQLQKIHEVAQTSISTASSAGSRISRLDALLAHIWRIIVKARQVPGSDTVSLDMSLGLRPRTSPPLPETFLGSPLTNISAQSTVSDLMDTSLGHTAMKMRETVTVMTPQATSALLHHLAFALDPTREWNAFLGSHNLMVTSWLGTGAWDIDFGGGKALNVGAGIDALDGLIVLMDERPIEEHTHEKKGRWYDDGARVRICLVEDVMRRVLSDPSLWLK